MKRVKHFRFETPEKRYLLALVPIHFGRLADDRAVEAAIATEGQFMLAIDADAYVEADPYGWISKDWNLAYAHFYLRERANDLRGGQVLTAAEVIAEVMPLIKKLGLREPNSAAPPPEQSKDAVQGAAA